MLVGSSEKLSNEDYWSSIVQDVYSYSRKFLLYCLLARQNSQEKVSIKSENSQLLQKTELASGCKLQLSLQQAITCKIEQCNAQKNGLAGKLLNLLNRRKTTAAFKRLTKQLCSQADANLLLVGKFEWMALMKLSEIFQIPFKKFFAC